MFANNVHHVHSALAGVNVAIQSLQNTCRELQQRVDDIGNRSLQVDKQEYNSVNSRLDRLESLINTHIVKTQTQSPPQNQITQQEVVALVQADVKKNKDLMEMSLIHKFDTHIPKLVHDQVAYVEEKVTLLSRIVDNMEGNMEMGNMEMATIKNHLFEVDAALAHLSSTGPRRVNVLEKVETLDLEKVETLDLDLDKECLGENV